jgi:hypothetical protein
MPADENDWRKLGREKGFRERGVAQKIPDDQYEISGVMALSFFSRCLAFLRLKGIICSTVQMMISTGYISL